ncbi:hypothetical protein RhiJN_16991 [Ceratobasidium sp. AG-Ba]|nr:hypothetical protein RhiJN_16991 [Ceratobasidium sp. AG-Ba]
MHNTHPLLYYRPIPQSPDCSSLECMSRTGWTPRIYRAEDGTVVSGHELKSTNEQNRDQWGVEAIITGKLTCSGSVAVYGIPKAHITNTDYLGPICVLINSSRCEVVDVQNAYLNAESVHEPVLLWRHDALDSSRKTRIAVRLIKTTESEITVFPFKAIKYYEPQEYASSGRSVGRLENIELAHDHGRIAYYPGRRCVRHFGRICTKSWDPWVWREEGPRGSRLTYRSTIQMYRTTEDPSMEMDFQGSAVYVYGAPKAFIGAPLASQHICVNNPGSDTQDLEVDERHLQWVDNAIASGVHPEHEPVLIWSMTGLDDQVSHKLRLALAGLPSKDDAEMSIVKIVYTKVAYEAGESRPDPPVPQPDPRYEGPTHPPYAREYTLSQHTPPQRDGVLTIFSVLIIVAWAIFFLLFFLAGYMTWGWSFGYQVAITLRLVTTVIKTQLLRLKNLLS